jgi:G2/mitotic-specific cyclin 1/2
MGATAASRAKVGGVDENKVDPALQGKRKCEALGEVTTKNINKNKFSVMDAKDEKSKAKEVAAPIKETFDGIVIKTKTVSSRQPLRMFPAKDATTTTSTGRTTRSVIASEVKPLEEIKEDQAVSDDDAMAVDEYPPVAEPSRRISTCRSGANTQKLNVFRRTRD